MTSLGLQINNLYKGLCMGLNNLEQVVFFIISQSEQGIEKSSNLHMAWHSFLILGAV